LVVIDGGDGHDILDYSYLHGDVSVDFNDGSIVSIERYIGSTGKDTVFASVGSFNYLETDGLASIDGNDGIDNLSYLWFGESIVVTTGNPDNDSLDIVEALDQSGDTNWRTTFYNFEEVRSGSDDKERLSGTKGDDIIFGKGGDDTLSGGKGNDTLEGGKGADKLNGGAGIDTIDYLTSSSSVWINMEGGNGFFGDASGDTFSMIENVSGSGLSDSISGDTGDNYILGHGGDDQFIINTNAGQDTFDGGRGSDTIDFYDNVDYGGITINLTTGINGGGATGLTLIDVENVEGGRLAGNHILTGNFQHNRLYGGNANDQLFGMAGDDSLFGGIGNDIINGGGGNDLLYGDAGNDTIIGNDDDDTIYGGDGNDTIYGDDGNDYIDGGSGNDTIYGGSGDDQIIGGFGIDVMDGGIGNDTVDVSHAGGPVGGGIIDLSSGTINWDKGQVDTAINFENIIGSQGDDTLIGSSGNNALNGGAGNDRLIGGDGYDWLTGGSGADIIELNFGDGHDRMYDFEDGIDIIDLSSTGLSFADLNLRDTDIGVEIGYEFIGNGPKVTAIGDLELEGILASQISEADFLFA